MGTAKGDDLAFAGAFEPLDMVFLGIVDEAIDSVSVAGEMAMVAQLVLHALVVDLLYDVSEPFDDGLERP